ncbi:MAG: MBL fold metallo-hydrolase [Woeseiaceae bacterium]|nr:MBL fold metallo-hydrolase [Woeseiaceae bacterium]
MPTADITRYGGGIAAIDTHYVRPGLDASHLIVENGHAAFVDTGVNDSVPRLLDALTSLEIDPADVDYVFLTHVHLDHAGGAGLLMQSLPNARCVVHPRGAPHMADPSKLVAGTEAVYGVDRTRAIYGTIEAIDAGRMVVADDLQRFELDGRPLQALYTEGHARHHYVLHDPQSRGMFTGDSFGVSYRELDTAAGAFIFPTTTPIDFDPEAAHVSIDRILSYEPRHAYLTHFGQVSDLERLAADLHGDIDAFREIALDVVGSDDRQALLQQRLFEYLAARLARHGFAGDRDAMRAILGVDMMLNAQGLCVWLDRRSKSA